MDVPQRIANGGPRLPLWKDRELNPPNTEAIPPHRSSPASAQATPS